MIKNFTTGTRKKNYLAMIENGEIAADLKFFFVFFFSLCNVNEDLLMSIQNNENFEKLYIGCLI